MTTEIITDLKGENNSAFGKLYQEYFGMVHHFVMNNSGNIDDAEDLFQDTMMVLIQKLRQDDFELSASIKTYIMAISKNIWLKKLRDGHQETEYSEIHEKQINQEIDLAIEEEKSYKDKLQTFIHKVTKHCQGLIHDLFFKEKSIEQIQKDYGYSTKHNAQNQKHKCVEQIKKVKKEEDKKVF